MAINVAIAWLAIRIHTMDVVVIGDAPPSYHIAANAAMGTYYCTERNGTPVP